MRPLPRRGALEGLQGGAVLGEDSSRGTAPREWKMRQRPTSNRWVASPVVAAGALGAFVALCVLSMPRARGEGGGGGAGASSAPAQAQTPSTSKCSGGNRTGPIPPHSRGTCETCSEDVADPPPPDTGGGTPTPADPPPPDTGGGTPTPPDTGGGQNSSTNTITNDSVTVGTTATYTAGLPIPDVFSGNVLNNGGCVLPEPGGTDVGTPSGPSAGAPPAPPKNPPTKSGGGGGSGGGGFGGDGKPYI